MNKITCKHCNAEITETNINRREQVAQCTRCNTMFYFGENPITTNTSKPIITELPNNLSLFDNGKQLLITIKQKGFTKAFMSFFALFWNAIVFVFVGVSISSGNYMILLFISLHLLVGVGVAYYALILWVNKPQLAIDQTYVLYNQGKLKIPFKKDFYVEVSNIKQLFCQKYAAGTVNGRPVFNFRVMIRKFNNEDIVLVNKLPKYHQALFIEQKIEAFLNIIDTPIEEAYR